MGEWYKQRCDVNVMKNKRKLHEIRMLENIDDDLDELPSENFIKAFEKIKSKPGKKYEFFKGGGKSLMNVLYKLFSVVW